MNKDLLTQEALVGRENRVDASKETIEEHLDGGMREAVEKTLNKLLDAGARNETNRRSVQQA